MQIATAYSTAATGVGAITEAYQSINSALGGPPDLLIVSTTVTYNCQEIIHVLAEMAPSARIHGSTSCLGVMTEQGFFSNQGQAIGLFGIRDPDGAYGTGLAALDNDPENAAKQATREALSNAGRPGETPEAVWVSATPGYEECILQGIEDLVGSGVPIIGGSAADNSVAGEWQIFNGSQVDNNAVIVSVLFPSNEVMFSFHSGYEPTAQCGKVTKADGRTIIEIDNQPAIQVYNQWTGGILDETLQKGDTNILALTTLYPLGRVAGTVQGTPYYQLSHPEKIINEQGIALFTEIHEGEELILMQGTKESLIERAGKVAKTAYQTYELSADQVAGALVIYCAGCMLTVQSEMDQVVSSLQKALPNTPFLGTFTFGEQGCFIGGENRHGNLMISVLAFGAK